MLRLAHNIGTGLQKSSLFKKILRLVKENPAWSPTGRPEAIPRTPSFVPECQTRTVRNRLWPPLTLSALPAMSQADELVIYHNPRCGKSRAALALLTGRGLSPRVIEYLKEPPSRAELERIVAQLGIPAADLVRRGEDIFKSDFAGKTLSEAQWLDALADHPILIERPIAVRGGRAVIGRPPERVLELL